MNNLNLNFLLKIRDLSMLYDIFQPKPNDFHDRTSKLLPALTQIEVNGRIFKVFSSFSELHFLTFSHFLSHHPTLN